MRLTITYLVYNVCQPSRFTTKSMNITDLRAAVSTCFMTGYILQSLQPEKQQLCQDAQEKKEIFLQKAPESPKTP